ncbi:hypothetical protein [Micromonospora sp. NPDC050200]|uniref:hypothetical protein n=1 Tax=Micromonospora sp. NPDC050200 TaxID=3155664 RepID=UPI0034066EBB
MTSVAVTGSTTRTDTYGYHPDGSMREPPADFGFLPRPDYVLEVVPVDMLDDEDAGFVLYLNGEEPIDIEIVENRG